MSDKGFIITDITGLRKDYITMAVLRGRLRLSQHFGGRVTAELRAVRIYADKYGYDKPIKTAKQALEFLELAQKMLTNDEQDR
ncbi:hypothetical protein SEA_WESAK_23 [Microbacterium phage Wesak]|uniref:Uncharacterized protein n=1 Tax=Microbacterium phage Wesak TaxID=2653751 RepID=A0A5Q2WJP5_9CAUD|nr:hypothetical protein SEA_WESAK_23 [Microbacterium phage Wesak]